MFNVYSCRLVNLRELNQKEVSALVFKVQVIGIVAAAVNIAEISALVPGVAVNRGVEYEARMVFGTCVKYVNSVYKSSLGVSCRIRHAAGLAYLPVKAVISAYRVTKLVLVCLVISIGVKHTLGIKKKRAISVATGGFVFDDAALLKAFAVVSTNVKAIYVLVGSAEKILVTVYHCVYYAVFVNNVIHPALIGNAFVRLRPGHATVGAANAHRCHPRLAKVRSVSVTYGHYGAVVGGNRLFDREGVEALDKAILRALKLIDGRICLSCVL